LSVKAPPRIGPTTDAIPNILDKHATYIGRLAKGTENPMIVNPPENKAEAPAPAIALPMMSIGELVAAAHTTDPTIKNPISNSISKVPTESTDYILSNNTRAPKYVHLTLK